MLGVGGRHAGVNARPPLDRAARCSGSISSSRSSLWIGDNSRGAVASMTWFEHRPDWALDPAVRHPLPPGHGRPEPFALMLTFFLGIMSVLASWTEITGGVGFFHLNLLLILAGITGVFLAVDLFLFYFAWELMLVPMYFLIAIWGHERRIYAAVKFFIFTQLSGLLMLIAILALYFFTTRTPASTRSSTGNCWARKCPGCQRCGSCSASSSPSP